MEMFSLPPIPPFSGLHPLVVHFPIALLLITPLLLLAGIFFSRDRRPFALAALLLLVLGTGASWVATYSGVAAEEAADDLSEVSDILPEHEEAGYFVRNAFTAITVLYGAFTLLLIKRGDRIGGNAYVGTQLAFVALCAAGSLVVANAGHLGGVMVHQYGIRAPIAGGTGGPDAEDSGDADEAEEETEAGE